MDPDARWNELESPRNTYFGWFSFLVQKQETFLLWITSPNTRLTQIAVILARNGTDSRNQTGPKCETMGSNTQVRLSNYWHTNTPTISHMGSIGVFIAPTADADGLSWIISTQWSAWIRAIRANSDPESHGTCTAGCRLLHLNHNPRSAASCHHARTPFQNPGGTELNEHMLSITTPRFFLLGHVWLGVLKFNKYCSTFILFDKKFSILD
jgi:hypothetical protein